VARRIADLLPIVIAQRRTVLRRSALCRSTPARQ